MYKTVLFDLDGTLLNTIDDLADSANRVCAAHGWPQHTAAQYCYFVGNGIVNFTICMLITVGGLGFLTWDDIKNHKFNFKRFTYHIKWDFINIIYRYRRIIKGTEIFKSTKSFYKSTCFYI